MNCPICNTPNETIGFFGDSTHYRCRACGWGYSEEIQPEEKTVPTKTYTLLITITNDEVIDPKDLARRIESQLETGSHGSQPPSAATVDCFEGDLLECKPGSVGATAAVGPGAAKRLHQNLHKP